MAVDAEARVRLSLVDRLTGPLRRVSARVAAMSEGLGVNRIGRSITNLGGSFGRLNSGLADTATRLGAVGGLLGLGGAGVAAGIVSLTNSTAAAAKEIKNLSRLANTDTASFQKIAYAARSVGIEQDKLSDIFKDVNDKVGDFLTTGGGELQDFFKKVAPRVGVTAKQFKDLSGPEALQLYISSLQKAGLNQQEMTFYMESIADEATALIPLFQDNGKALRELGEEAEATGNVMDKQAIEMAGRYSRSVQRLTTRFTGLRNMVGVALLPIVTKLTDALSGWFDANRELVSTKITEWAGALSRVMTDLLDPTSDLRARIGEIIEQVTGFADALAPFVDFVGGPLNAAMLTIGAWTFAPTVSALVSLSGAFWTLGAAIASTPVGWILGGLALLGASAYVLYKRWDDFAAFWSDTWADVAAAFDRGFIDGIMTALDRFNPVRLIARGLSEVVEYFTGLDLYGMGVSLVERLKEGVLSVDWAAVGSRMLSTYLEALSRTWGRVVAWAETTPGQIAGYFDIVDLGAYAIRAIDGWLSAARASWTRVSQWGSAIASTVRAWFDLGLSGLALAAFNGWLGAARRTWARAVAWGAGIKDSVVAWFTVDIAGPAQRSVAGWLSAARSAWSNAVAWASGLAGEFVDLFRFDLAGAASAAIGSFLAGLQSAWSNVSAWVAEKVAALKALFQIDLFEVGYNAAMSLLSGLQSAWGQVTAWFGDAIASLVSMMPGWLQDWVSGGSIDLKVSAADIGATSRAGVDIGRMAPQPIQLPTMPQTPQPSAARSVAGIMPDRSAAMAGTQTAGGKTDRVQTQTVEAVTVDAARFEAPEPLLVHKPQTVDASTHVGTINLHGVDMNNSAAVKAAVAGALREQSRRVAADKTSELSD